MGRTTIAIALLCAGCGRLWFDPIDDPAGGDGGMPDGTTIVGDAAMPGVNVNVAFVTASDVVPGALGGLAGADARCQADADAAGLMGTYIAWLSTSSVNAIDRLAGSRGWVRPDGVPFVDTVEDLAAGAILAPISVLANGTDALFDTQRFVATGTNASGTVQGTAQCSDWSVISTDPVGIGSIDAIAGSWTFDFGPVVECGEPVRLYCFGIGRNVVVQPPPVVGRRAFTLAATLQPGAGLAAFDAACQGEADASALGGSWLAFAATETATAASRFDPSGPTWVRLDGLALAPTATDLLTTGFRNALNLNADGTNKTTSGVWTGAVSPVELGVATSCVSWTSAVGGQSGQQGGSSRAGVRALASGGRQCTSTFALYCFEE